jgi:hypothetical protein
MKNFIYVLVVIFAFSCTNSSKEKNVESLTSEAVSQEIAVVNVESLLANAADYEGKEVMIIGTVTHVCKHSGKRLHLLGSDEKTMVRLEAGEIGQFERELEGSEIIAKGIFRREVIDEEYLAKWTDELGKEGEHKSNEEQEEEKDKMQQYRKMMKETEEGYLENFWVDGISFEAVEEEVAI